MQRAQNAIKTVFLFVPWNKILSTQKTVLEKKTRLTDYPVSGLEIIVPHYAFIPQFLLETGKLLLD